MEIKNSHVNFHMLHAHKVISGQINMSYGVCKKTINGDKIKAFHMTIFFLFLHRPEKVSVFRKTLQTHLDCGYVNAKKIYHIFLTLGNIFFG
jgi:hypothetical protein